MEGQQAQCGDRCGKFQNIKESQGMGGGDQMGNPGKDHGFVLS